MHMPAAIRYRVRFSMLWFVTVCLLFLFACRAATALLESDDLGIVSGDRLLICGVPEDSAVFVSVYLSAAHPELKTTCVYERGGWNDGPTFAQRVLSRWIARYNPTVIVLGPGSGNMESVLDFDSLLMALGKCRPATSRIVVVGRGVSEAAVEKALGNDLSKVKVVDILSETTNCPAISGSLTGNTVLDTTKSCAFATTIVILRALGLGDGDIADIEMDVQHGTATINDGHEIQAADMETVRVKSFRYPFCFDGGLPFVSAEMRNTALAMRFFDDFNRFIIRVPGAYDGKYLVRVEYESDGEPPALITREQAYSVARVRKGINLAEEFNENAFCSHFVSVYNRVYHTVHEMHRAIELGYPQLTNILTSYTNSFPVDLDGVDISNRQELATALDKGVRDAMTPCEFRVVVKNIETPLEFLPQGQNWFKDPGLEGSTLEIVGNNLPVDMLRIVEVHGGAEYCMSLPTPGSGGAGRCLAIQSLNGLGHVQLWAPFGVSCQDRLRKFVFTYSLKTDFDPLTGDVAQTYVHMSAPNFVGARVTYPRTWHKRLSSWTRIGGVFKLVANNDIGSIRWFCSIPKGMRLYFDDFFFTEVTDLDTNAITTLVGDATLTPDEDPLFDPQYIDYSDPVKGNKLRDSSFELIANGPWGRLPFSGCDRFRFLKEDFYTNAPFSGKQSFWFGERSGVLVHQDVPVSVYKKHTLSAYVKATGPAPRFSFSLRAFTGSKHEEPLFRYDQSFQPTETWQRFAMTEILGPAPRRGYHFRITGRNVAVDNVQFEEGDISDYTPFGGEVDVALTTAPVAHLFFTDENAVVKAAIFNSDKQAKKIALRFQVWDAFDMLKQDDPFTVKLTSGETQNISFPIKPNTKGALRAEIRDVTGSKILAEQVFSVVPRPCELSEGKTSICGAHMAFDEFSLSSAAALGIKWARTWDSYSKLLHWRYIEPQQGNWVYPDDKVELTHRHGINILGLLVSVPVWHVPEAASKHDDVIYPPDYGLWRKYVENVVSRYKDSVKYWEIWNEPTNPDQYLELCQNTTPIVRQKNPHAVIMGLSGVPTGAVRRFCELGGAKMLDVLTCHIYVFAPGGALGRNIEAYRALSIAHGGTGRIWNTEASYGRLGGPLYKTRLNYDAVKGDMRDIPRFLTVNKAHGVEVCFYYANPFPQHQGVAEDPGHTFFHHDTSIKPGGVAHAVFAALLDETDYVATFAESTDEVYLFRKGDKLIVALWTMEEREICLPEMVLGKGMSVIRYDVMGMEYPVSAGKEQRFVIGENIMYIAFAGFDQDQVVGILMQAGLRRDSSNIQKVNLVTEEGVK
ncbi:MAG: hypothetical protein JXN60_00280 [Lentisphaerae bacterium]|nr:hypothetical protein [Lentisphaerota bacterium]